MFRLAKSGYGKALSRGGNSHSGLRRKDAGIVNCGRHLNPTSAHDTTYIRNVGAAWGATAVRAPTAAQFFSLAKPMRTTRAQTKRAPFSATATPQEAAKEAAKPKAFVDHWDVPPKAREFIERTRETFLKPRRYLQWAGMDTWTTYTNQCGHGSFFVMTIAFLETDVLALRGYALSSLAMNACFQYFRLQSLYLPLCWDFVLVLINISMIILLLKDRSDAEKLKEDPEQSALYTQVFAPVDLTPIDFLKLMKIAERREISEGEYLFHEGNTQTDVLLIAEGTAEVDAENVAVCHLEPKQFVGSMAFIRYVNTPPPPVRHKSVNPIGEHLPDLSHYKEPEKPAERRGMLREAKQAVQALRRQDTFIGDIAKALVPAKPSEDEEDMEKSPTTVVSTSDVVVYSWNMHELREFMEGRPAAGAAFQRAISMDLTHKVDQSRGQKERYRLLLAEALRGGVVTPVEKKKLQRYRQTHSISMDDHVRMLERYKWDEAEFNAGFKGGIGSRSESKSFNEYEDVLQRELVKGKVDAEARAFLRDFRMKAGINSHEHLLALEKQGWTADEYEVGHKEKMEIEDLKKLYAERKGQQ